MASCGDFTDPGQTELSSSTLCKTAEAQPEENQGALFHDASKSTLSNARPRVPKSVPLLAGWATPAGWLEGLRPSCAAEQKPSGETVTGNGRNGQHNCNSGIGHGSSLVREIEQMEQIVGKRMYRGLLKTVARVWNPKDIQDPATQQKVLANMQAAERGLHRARVAQDKVGLAALAAIMGPLRLSSLDQVDNLRTLQQIVVALEAAAGAGG